MSSEIQYNSSYGNNNSITPVVKITSTDLFAAYSVATSGNGNNVIVARLNQSVILVSENYAQNYTSITHKGWWTSVAMSDSGKYVYLSAYRAAFKVSNPITTATNVFVSDDYGKTLFDMDASRNSTYSTANNAGGNARTIECSRTGEYVSYMNSSNQIYYSRDYGKTFVNIVSNTTNAYGSCSMSRSGKYLAFIGSDNNIKLFKNSSISNTSSFLYDISYTNFKNKYSQDCSGGVPTSVKISGNGKIILVTVAAFYSGTPSVLQYNGGIFISKDFGTTWTNISNNILNGNTMQWRSITCSENGQHLTVTKDVMGIYISNNYGINWNTIDTSSFSGWPASSPYKILTTSNSGQCTYFLANMSNATRLYNYVANNYTYSYTPIKISYDNSFNFTFTSNLYDCSGTYYLKNSKNEILATKVVDVSYTTSIVFNNINTYTIDYGNSDFFVYKQNDNLLDSSGYDIQISDPMTVNATWGYTTPSVPYITTAVVYLNQITMNFTQPDLTGGTPILGYRYSTNSGVSYTDLSANATQFVLTNMNSQSYTIWLKAYNVIGDSSYNEKVVTMYELPIQPIITTAVVSLNQITVNFNDASLNAYKGILGYRYSTNSGVSYTDLSANARQFVLTNMNDQSYNIWLKAYNVVGESTYDTENVIMYELPIQPIITTAVVSLNQITVNFNDASLNAYKGILGYRYSTNSGASYITLSSTTREFVLSNMSLQNYTVWLKAYNIVGDSSAVEIAVTMYNTPNAPTITSVVPGTSQVQVYFTPGDMNFSTFAGYKYSTDGVNYYWTKENASPITITGLTAGLSYNITLKCVSENAGTSLASTQSASFTPYSVPIIPTISSVSIGDGVASVYYTDGSSNGSPITMHKYSLDGGNYIDVSSGSPITLSGLTNGKPYSVTIKSVNSAGTSNGSRPMVFVPYAVPSNPIILNVIPSSNQATVYIQHGNDNGADIATYSYSLNNSAFVSTGNANTIFTISGLTNGTLYNIKVIASNAAGNSAVSEPYTITPSSVPNPPTNLVITAINEGISVSFTDGVTNGAPINYYLYSLNDGQDIPAKKNTNGNIHIFDLLNGTNYSIKLKAVNNAGASNYSSAVNWFTRFERPIVPVVTNIKPGNGSAYVYFDETITNESSVEQFYYSLNGLPPVPLNISQLTSPLTIPGLINKRNYNISIASRIGGNISTVSNTKTVTVGVPLAPVITNVVPGFKNMKVYFNVPFDNGFPISDYVYGLNNNSIISKSSVLTDDDGSYLVISHLTNGRSYVPYLCAININGKSEQSNTLPSVKPGSIPNTISIVTVTPYLMGSLLYFNTPASNGHPITKYKYAINDDTNFVDVSGISIPLAIYNTPINTPFTVRLIATNALGDTPASAPSRAVTFVYLPPSKIHIRSLKMPTKNSLLVSFYTPALNGSPITKYKYALNGSSQYIDVSGTTLPFLITQGIVPNVDYNISVIAVNSSTVNNGESIPSEPFAKPVRFKYLAPEKAPIIGSIVGGNTIAIVSVLSVELRGAPIIGYAYSTDGVNLIDIPNTVSSPLTITGLTNDISYNMRIAAKTEMGYSPLSIAQSVMPVYKVPNTPVIRYFVKGNRNLTVSFTVPASNGAPITGYKYRLNNGVKIPAVLNSDGKSFLITKNIVYGSDVLLTNGATYNVQMLAINEVGESELSVTKSVTVN